MTFQGSPRIKTMTLSVLFNTIISVFALKCLLFAEKSIYYGIHGELYFISEKRLFRR